MSTERIDIYGGKATIKQNKFGVWQFRMWVSNEKRYYEKSLRTKRRAEAIDKAEEMYFDLQNELKDGRKLFSVTIAEAKKNERTNVLKEVKRLCKEFGFTAGMLKGSLAEGRKAKDK